MESCCTLPVAREQAGQTASAEVAVNSYAQVLANSQGDLVNSNLALSDENARLQEVITTLRQDDTSLKQILDGYEQRLMTLEQSMVGSAHPDTPLVGVQNTTPVGSANNTTPVGETHRPPVSKAHMASQTEFAGTAGPRARQSASEANPVKVSDDTIWPGCLMCFHDLCLESCLMCFHDLCLERITEDILEEGDPLHSFVKHITKAANDSIPRATTIPKKANPWFDEECREALKARWALDKRVPGVKSLRDSLINTICVFSMTEPTPIWNLKPRMSTGQHQR